ncbi:conserved hypothetical protein [Caldicellulosiruptor hydrothermalis 108]|uniref:Uncharacterized protein n=1 Tax=Caldicellulosiruptor hydrothermalis (strain DSM 18901 / VKM B-2411 / 108) TaxID=632292 RepID=E4QB07_CALH1|nr:hypothetical protein [Caldicellulosiruptor hydrothermalis]ADQ08313.1 conserved hypothetical protein [Caldicellulosiruptor hydrothermalis 108]
MNIGFLVIFYLSLFAAEYYILKRRYLQKEMFFTSLLIFTGLVLSLILNTKKNVPNPHILIEKLFDKLFSLFM